MTQKRHTRPRFSIASSAVAIILLAGGCASRYDDLKVFVQKHEQDVAVSEYTVQPPDVLAINSPTCPEINGETQTIAPDGKITLELLGEVKVAGMTPRELSTRLKELLTIYYTEPEVSVRVVQHSSQKVFVFGEVYGPGPQPFTGRDSVLDILAACQMNNYAWGSRVKIIRPGPSAKERHEIIVDVDHMMQTGDTSGNVLLQEGDIVYVPPTPLAWTGEVIQEILFPFRSAAQGYSMPAVFMGANDYYQDRGRGRTSVRLSAGGAGSFAR